MLYISIDGDDIGDKITVSYLNNSEEELSQTIQNLHEILSALRSYLKSLGFEIIFCAADGIACKGMVVDLGKFSEYLKTVGGEKYTFSAGIGDDLKSSYFALRYAKAAGKNMSAIYKNGENFEVI